MRILIAGPQGSGKTTQAEFISKKLNIPLIDIGRILRNLAKGDSDDAKVVKETIARGVLSPDKIAADLMRVEIKKSGGNFVADGYPRSINQLKLFDPGYDMVFYLDIADRKVVERLLKRGREDDALAVIDARLKNYHILTEPLLEQFKHKGILSVINGDDSIENIHQKIWSRVKTSIS